MLRLKGKSKIDGYEISFLLTDVFWVSCDEWHVKDKSDKHPDNCFTHVVDPATIQPCDDPRKAMLDEIRQISTEILNMSDFNPKGTMQFLSAKCFNSFIQAKLDELEAKL